MVWGKATRPLGLWYLSKWEEEFFHLKGMTIFNQRKAQYYFEISCTVLKGTWTTEVIVITIEYYSGITRCWKCAYYIALCSNYFPNSDPQKFQTREDVLRFYTSPCKTPISNETQTNLSKKLQKWNIKSSNSIPRVNIPWKNKHCCRSRIICTSRFEYNLGEYIEFQINISCEYILQVC